VTRLLAYDLGGSSLRVAIVSIDEGVIASTRLPMSLPGGYGGEYEADPNTWWSGFVAGCRALARDGADLSAVEAIAGCGFTRTQVPVDQGGAIVHPAITFQDSRGTQALNDYLDRAAPDLRDRCNALSPFHPIARLLWLQSRKPEVWAKVGYVLEPKDYINFRLTGQVGSDHVSQHALRSFFDVVSSDTISCAALGFDDCIAPKSVSPFDEIGQVQAYLPEDLKGLVGKPVYCGSTDTWVSVLGCGALTPGAAYCISGTSDVSGILTAQPHYSDGLLTVRWGPELWQLGGPSQGAATRLIWAVDRFAPGQDVVAALNTSFASAGKPPIFLPFLEGERTPYWDNDMRGAFLGLDHTHTNPDFVRAVAEGINFLSREILQCAETAIGSPAPHICFAGGLSNNPLLCQLKADVTNRPVFVSQHKESGLMGLAYLPCHSSADLTAIAAAITQSGSWYPPDASRRDEMDARFAAFTQATHALRPITQALLETTRQQGIAP